MLTIVILCTISSVNSFDLDSVPDPSDLWDEVSPPFNDVLDEFEDIIDEIPNIPDLLPCVQNPEECADLAKCAADAIAAMIDPTFTSINDITIAIREKSTMIQECKSTIIYAVKTILSGNKNAYLDLAKGFFTKCSELNAGAITIEIGGGAAFILGYSAAVGLAIDTTNGNVYYYKGGCVGFVSDITAGGGITLSLFNSIGDVAGCSKYYAVGMDVNIIGIEAGLDAMVVYNLPAENIIARGMGFDVGVGLNPQSIEQGYCYTFEPTLLVDLNKFKEENIINTIPALLMYLPQTQTLLHEQQVRFRCYHLYSSGFGYYMHHYLGGQAGRQLWCGLLYDEWIDTIVPSDNMIFTVRPALNGNDGEVSFESKDWSGQYIHIDANGQFVLDNPQTWIGVFRGSFIVYNGFNDNHEPTLEMQIMGLPLNPPQFYSFGSSTDGERYKFMRTRGPGWGEIWFDVWEDTADYKHQISFTFL